MVDRKRAGYLVNLESLRARLSPVSTSFASLLSFIVIIAISAHAKIALIRIKTNCKSSRHPNPNMFPITSFLKTLFKI
jgi:hypothetical protein